MGETAFRTRSHRYSRARLTAVPTSTPDDAGEEVALFESSELKVPHDWSPDGRFLIFRSRDQLKQPDTDLWLLPFEGDRRPFPWLKTGFNGDFAQFSPNGRWVAYESDEAGRREVYVRPFDGRPASQGGVWQVSRQGGRLPRWSADGQEVYFLDPNDRLMAASIAAAGDAFSAGAPILLFQTNIYSDNRTGGWQYDVAPDGRFLIVTVDEAPVGPIALLQNWTPPDQ